jgi:hypothetical protein
MIKAAHTDSTRHITYDPIARPEVSNLVLLAALCLDRDPHDVAEALGDAVPPALALAEVLGDGLEVAAGRILAEVFAVLVELALGLALELAPGLALADPLALADGLALGLTEGVVVPVAP